MPQPGSGRRYDPKRDKWSPMSTVNAPTERANPALLWTGHEMIAWGGGYENTGGRYDPVNNLWAPLDQGNAPDGRTRPDAVWTGDEMIV